MAFQRPFLISLRRDNAGIPWGFRLIGGTDVQPQHIVQQVLEGSQAERAGLHEGDEVIQVGRVNVQSISHREVQEVIEHCGNRVELFVIREDLLRSRKENEPPVIKAVVHSKYNSPFQLYSTENVADTLALQTTVLTDRPDSPSKIQLNHLGPQSPPVVIESNVLKLLKEEEDQPTPPPRRKIPPTPPPKPSVRFREPPASTIDITEYGQISDARYQQEQYQLQQQRYQNQQQASENYHHQTIGNYQQPYKRQTSQEQKSAPWEESKYAKIDTATQQQSRIPLQSRENYAHSYNQAQRATTAQYQQNEPPTRPAYQNQGSYTAQQTISIGQPKTQQQQYQEQHIQQSYQQRVTTTSSSSQQQSYSQQSEQIRQEQIRQEQIRQHELARQKFIQEQARQQEVLRQQQQQQVHHQEQARIEQLRLQQQSQQSQQQEQIRLQEQARIEQLRLQQQSQQSQQQDQIRLQEQARQDQLRQQYQEDQLRQQQIRQEQLRQQQYQQEQLRQQDLLRQQELARQEQLRRQQQLYQQQTASTKPGIKIPPVKTNPNYASHVGSMTKTGDRVPLHSTSRMTPDSPTMGSPNVTRRGGGTPVWPPKNSSVRELPRTGFSPNFTHDKGSKKFVWPPQENELVARPPTPSGGGAANAWHPEESTHTRSLPFVQTPPPNRRNKDIAWPPPHTIQRESPRHSPKVIRRKTGSFDDYIYQHAAVNVPPTYRTPPGTQHVEIVYEDDL